MNSKFRRGFKTEANAYATEFREELGLSAIDPLCPRRLASHLAIPVIGLREFEIQHPHEVGRFAVRGDGRFSAATLFVGCKRFIIHNDFHHERRQAADIAHELSHAILGHPQMPPFHDDGQRNFNSEHEREANWLGPALLISQEAAFHIVKSEMPMREAAVEYGVSEQLIQMRINVLAVRTRIHRSTR